MFCVKWHPSCLPLLQMWLLPDSSVGLEESSLCLSAVMVQPFSSSAFHSSYIHPTPFFQLLRSKPSAPSRALLFLSLHIQSQSLSSNHRQSPLTCGSNQHTGHRHPCRSLLTAFLLHLHPPPPHLLSIWHRCSGNWQQMPVTILSNKVLYLWPRSLMSSGSSNGNVFG